MYSVRKKRSLLIFVYLKQLIEIIKQCNPYHRFASLLGMSFLMFFSIFVILFAFHTNAPETQVKRASDVSQTHLKHISNLHT